MKINRDLCLKSENLVRCLIQTCLREWSLTPFLSVMHQDITWFGADEKEIGSGYEQTQKRLKQECSGWDKSLSIGSQWYHTKILDGTQCLLSGELVLVESGGLNKARNLTFRFSMIFIQEESKVSLTYVHLEKVKKALAESKSMVPQTDILSRKELEEALWISDKRYEIALQLSGITMFEYNVVTRELMLYERTAQMYGVSSVIQDGVEAFIQRGIVEPVSVPQFKEMYRKIHDGEPTASCYIKTKDVDGRVHDFELTLINIFDRDGKPVRAIGARKNISEIQTLQTEQEYIKNFVSGKTLLVEADISNDSAELIHESWRQEIDQADKLSYASLIIQAANHFVLPEHRQKMIDKLFPETIKQAYDMGDSPITFQYRYKEQDGSYTWHEAMIIIIKDQTTGNIRIRFYNMNISELKLKEKKVLEEQRMYESVIARSSLVYEVNITKNQAVRGHEYWDDLYGISHSEDYNQMIFEFSRKGTHPDDGESFWSAFNQKSVLRQFFHDERQISCQYRKLDSEGEYRWVNCTLHLYDDMETGEVKGFAYVEDIDEQKRSELAWKYSAEHDIMTGIYNKGTTEQKVKEFLLTLDGSQGRHAFLIVDIDYFKCVNDSFGHLFGDRMIKEIAGKIASIFRDQDIVGRIGGDEFCVFMKNVHADAVIEEKASEICHKIYKVYERDGKSCTISASVGIAIYREHGQNYEELYQRADHALYTAKKNGRNRYFMQDK